MCVCVCVYQGVANPASPSGAGPGAAVTHMVCPPTTQVLAKIPLQSRTCSLSAK